MRSGLTVRTCFRHYLRSIRQPPAKKRWYRPNSAGNIHIPLVMRDPGGEEKWLLVYALRSGRQQMKELFLPPVEPRSGRTSSRSGPISSGILTCRACS